MFQIRIHGRGGQGVVSGAEMLSVAAFLEGRYAQAFPSFGSERMGAPVMAFCRIDDKEIRLREPVLQPDALIIQDATLLHQVDLFSGLPARGHILLNSTKSFDELGLGGFARGVQQYRVCTLPATELALKHVGRSVPKRPARRVRRDHRCDRTEIGVGGDPREISRGYRREECRRCDGGFRHRDQSARDDRCLSKRKARAR